MPKHLKYFHREFLAMPEEEYPSDAITARIAKHDPESAYLVASLMIHTEYENVYMSFTSADPEEIDKAVARAKKFHEIVMKFTEELEMEAEEVKKTMASKKEE